MDLACRYVGGLLSETRRKNMERMDERIGSEPALRQDCYQATQQFISTTRWDESLLYARIARRAGERLGGTLDAVLCIDESSHAKKGKASVGVARQWNGRLGKEDNCQTGVYSALNCGTRVCLTGCRLYLPGEWIDDPERCRKAGVPESRIAQGHLTKIDHARELIDEAIANGLVFGCVAMDAFYGRDSTLRRFMEERGLTCCVDVPANARLFTEAPACTERLRPMGPVTKTAAEVAADVLKRRQRPVTTIMLRPGDDGDVEAQVCAERVWEWTEGEPAPTELWLVIRRMPDGSLKLSLCNAGKTTSLRRLAGWQAARFWVERCFQDAKSHCGMAQYQARGWVAWHHHMALVALAVLFQMQERMSTTALLPELTAADIMELMEWALIRRPSEVDLIERIARRHRKRETSARNKRSAAESRRRNGANPIGSFEQSRISLRVPCPQLHGKLMRSQGSYRYSRLRWRVPFAPAGCLRRKISTCSA